MKPCFSIASQQTCFYSHSFSPISYDVKNMILEHRSRVSKRQKLWRRKSGVLESQQKKLHIPPCLSEVQKKHQPQAFHLTALGKLTPQLRVQIYRHLLVAPRLPADGELQIHPPAVDSPLPDGSSVTTSPCFTHLRLSSLTILRTCRQVHLEAYPILYGGGVPYFADAQELFQFLSSVRPSDNKQLQVFRIGSLVSPDSFEGQETPNHHSRGKTDSYTTESFDLLRKCTNVHTIYIDMVRGQELTHFDFLQHFVNQQHDYLRSLGPHHWFVQRSKGLQFKLCKQELFPRGYHYLDVSGKPTRRHVLVKIEMDPTLLSRPFLQTGLGRLPPELRAEIYQDLVAAPPTHAGQEVTAKSVHAEITGPHRKSTKSTTFVHLQASSLAILETCRQIYVEASPVFYARTSYYAANGKELQHLIGPYICFDVKRSFRPDMVTSLCLKDVSIQGFSREKSTYPIFLQYGKRLVEWRNLRYVYLCMRVGEELQYIEVLFYLIPHFCLGVIVFLDDSRWIIRLQRPEEEWKTQYACICAGNYGKDKKGVELSYGDIRIQRQLLQIESRASGLEEGQERVVEVEIGGPLEKPMSFETRCMMTAFGKFSLE